MSAVKEADRCVVLPCGGEGQRLELPYPKELHVVLPGKSLIDFTLERLANLTRPFCVVVILSSGKDAIRRHLERRWPHLDVRYVLQSEPGFVGALWATVPELRTSNLLLLPDQWLEEEGALEAAFALLENGASTAVLSHQPRDRSSIADDGALRVEEGCVLAMEEKPGPVRAQEFNAIWCGIGFQGRVAPELFRSLGALCAKGAYSPEEWLASPLYRAPALTVRDYIDLGVWKRLVAFQKRSLK